MEAKSNLELDRIRNFWFDEVKPPLMKALDLAPDDKLDWAPADKMLSLGNIFMHIAEASMGWIEDVIDGNKFDELTPGPSLPKNNIQNLMNEHWQRLDNFFNRYSGITEKTYPIEWQGKTYNLRAEWIMLHLFEHDIHHRSQINQYLRILGINPPKI